MTRIPVLQPEGGNDAILPHGYRPRMAAAMEQLAGAVYQETTLTFREAEGARMRIAHINGCLMCQGYRIAEHLPAALRKMNSAEAPNVAAKRGEPPGEAYYQAVAGDWRSRQADSPRANAWRSSTPSASRSSPHRSPMTTNSGSAYKRTSTTERSPT